MSLQVASPGVRAALPRASAVPRAATDAADIWPHTDRLLPWGVAGFITMLMLVPFDAISLPITLPMDAKLDRPVLAVLAGLVAVPPDLHEIDPTGRTTVYGPMGHPLELALVIGLVVPLALVPTLQATERGQRWKWIALTGLLLAALFSTQRKTGMLAVGAGVLLVLIYRRELVRKMFPLLIGLMLVMHVLAPGAMGSLKQQLQPGHLTTASSNKQRSDDYTAVAPDLHKHLALGRGFGSYDGLKYRILDNQYLGLLIMVGIIGTVAYVAMYVAGVVGAHRYARMRGSPHGATMLALSAALTTFLVGSVLFDVLSFSHVTYMSFVVLGLAAVGARADAPGGPEDPAARSSEPGRWSRR
jgi:O-antigen ligase